MISAIAGFLMNTFSKMGYTGIVVLMTIESSFIPFPSEIVIPPAAYMASKGQMNIYLVILAGTLGSMLGAIINYFLAMWLGRSLVYKIADSKWMHYLMIDHKKIEHSEKYFNKYGNISTFVGRLIPAVRQLISIPAGLARMNFLNFFLFTLLGAGIWNVILALLGFYFGENEQLLKSYYKELSFIGITFGILLVAFISYKAYKKNK